MGGYHEKHIAQLTLASLAVSDPLPRLRSFTFLFCLALAAPLALVSCDTMGEHDDATVQERRPSSALSSTECAAAQQGEDSEESPIVSPTGEMVCVEYSVTEVCILDTETDELRDCEVTSTECVEWEYVGGGGGGGGPPGGGGGIGGGGGGDCCPTPPCEEPCFNPPGGGGEPVHDTTTIETENPCESASPPDYCDEAGSCFDRSIGNSTHEKIMEHLENQGALNQLWTDSNFNQSESSRLEQGGFLVPNSYNDDLTFQRLQPSNVTQQTPCKLRFQAPSDLPDGTIYVHTHPYTNGEQQNHCDTPIPVEYDNEVGVEDRPALQQMTLNEGLILDADKIIFYKADGNDPEGYATYDRCGY